MTFVAVSDMPCTYGTDDPNVAATESETLRPETTVAPRGRRLPTLTLAFAARVDRRPMRLAEADLSLENTADAIGLVVGSW